MMRGETVTIIRRLPAGHDPTTNDETFTTVEEQVGDVLCMPGTGSNATDSTRPDGVTVAWTLCFPRTWPYHSLRGALIRVRGADHRVVGDPHPVDGGMSPTRWNMTVPLADTRG